MKVALTETGATVKRLEKELRALEMELHTAMQQEDGQGSSIDTLQDAMGQVLMEMQQAGAISGDIVGDAQTRMTHLLSGIQSLSAATRTSPLPQQMAAQAQPMRGARHEWRPVTPQPRRASARAHHRQSSRRSNPRPMPEGR